MLVSPLREFPAQYIGKLWCDRLLTSASLGLWDE
jgi:hypothetical protein